MNFFDTLTKDTEKKNRTLPRKEIEYGITDIGRIVEKLSQLVGSGK